MPIRVTTIALSGQGYLSPFIGPTAAANTMAIAVTLSGLTAAEVDLQGYLKPGIPLLRTGALVTAGAVWGVTVESLKVAASSASADLTAGGSPEVAVCIIGSCSRAIMEDNLGRVLTAPEIAGFTVAGSLLKLVA